MATISLDREVKITEKYNRLVRDVVVAKRKQPTVIPSWMKV